MRRKKHKNTRRTVQFYKLHYGFREPFKVLLDGNFIHAAVLAKYPDATEQLVKLLGAPCTTYTTKCVMHELRQLGGDFQATYRAARKYKLHHCEHEEGTSGAECLLSQVQPNNNGHWFLATQDRAVQAVLAEAPGVPRVFMTVNGFHLERPPEKTRGEVVEEEQHNLVLPAHELKTAALKDLPGLKPKDDSYKKFRRNKAKGPNPLSVKKKKLKATGEPADASQTKASGKRRRRKKVEGGDITAADT